MTIHCDSVSTAGCAHGSAGHVAIVRTAAGWTVEGGGTPLAYYDSPPATPQEVGGVAEHMKEQGYVVEFRDERGGCEG